ncbi:CDP-diacylglycerol--serine O-phosphatidyltransferase [Pseudidiomarina marina]|uniref:CDP-diacylglycerol--serine O-phosphatidyltransferase n=1 Tax=Pseudidiomarina marina TaxID=502366 RepID=A0A432YCF2_9GAMM|nr:CDP-diacylglycerol--serine O-phosphatidyltransferase [Pseudidiomarina marina]PHR63287.1 MAG: CDP-diacylglycerol--serine O-phosphatidyltransferase [Idiomarina sp.]RUO58688.1 CDP-diacylglycerol--serine O-phosphatidyltransferase [Pseudidiomarina marina]
MPNKTEQSVATAKNRGIFLLPNLLTTAGLFSGFFAIVASMNGLFESAAVAIFIAMVFDGLDGRVARMTNTESAFGAEYDSMADIVSFGMAPALVMYNWGLSDLGKLGWLAAFIFVAGGALRLARFNTNLGTSDKRYFQGLAIPSAAAIVSGFVWVGSKYEIDPSNVSYIAAVLTIAAGLLMVSNFRYHSFKDVDWRDRVPFIAILLIVLAFVVVATEPSLVLFSIFLLYAISGPITTFRTVKKIKLEHVVGDSDCEETEEATKNQQNSSENESKSSAKNTTD